MKYINLILGLCLWGVSIIPAELSATNKKDTIWKQQLDMVKEKSQTVNDFKEEIKYPQLLNYAYIGPLKNAADVRQIKEALTTDSCYFPVSLPNKSLKVRTLKEIKSESEDAFSAIKKVVDELVQVGYSKVELTWKHDSLVFKTICIVSDTGIVYDNIIANLMLPGSVKEKSGPI